MAEHQTGFTVSVADHRLLGHHLGRRRRNGRGILVGSAADRVRPCDAHAPGLSALPPVHPRCVETPGRRRFAHSAFSAAQRVSLRGCSLQLFRRRRIACGGRGPGEGVDLAVAIRRSHARVVGAASARAYARRADSRGNATPGMDRCDGHSNRAARCCPSDTAQRVAIFLSDVERRPRARSDRICI
jgi:hypothetical protein